MVGVEEEASEGERIGIGRLGFDQASNVETGAVHCGNGVVSWRRDWNRTTFGGYEEGSVEKLEEDDGIILERML